MLVAFVLFQTQRVVLGGCSQKQDVDVREHREGGRRAVFDQQLVQYTRRYIVDIHSIITLSIVRVFLPSLSYAMPI